MRIAGVTVQGEGVVLFVGDGKELLFREPVKKHLLVDGVDGDRVDGGIDAGGGVRTEGGVRPLSSGREVGANTAPCSL